MAWNSLDPDKTSRKLPRKSPHHSSMRGVVIGLLVVVCVVIFAWWLRSTDQDVASANKNSRKSLITEVTTNLSVTQTNEKMTQISARDLAPKELPPQQLGEVRDGYVLLGSGLHKIRGEVTNNCSLTKGKYEIFKHPAENIIAGLLSVKAGDMLVGTPNYGGAFKESLIRSFQDPITIEATDTPEQIELKNAVAEAKEELKKAMDRGEDVEQLILESRRECQSLARCKQYMMADVYEFVDKKAVTKDDVETYVEAANKLLEAKGIAPIERTTLVDIKLRHKLDDYDPETDPDVIAEEESPE